jgi:uncharacterized protein
MTQLSAGWKKSGLSDSDQRVIEETIERTPGISEVVLFGSRAMGTARIGSDVDLIVRCLPGVTPAEVVRALSSALNEESCLPYRFDVIAFELTAHRELLEHVARFGRPIWRMTRG